MCTERPPGPEPHELGASSGPGPADSMPKGSYSSKALAAAAVVLSVSVIASIVTMIVFYKIQIGPENPTPRPPRPSTTPAPPPDIRLPRTLWPERYDVLVQPHFYSKILQPTEPNATSPNQTMLFTGNSTVHFRCVRATHSIYLHSKDLNVSGPVVMDEDGGQRIPVRGMHHSRDGSDFLEIQLGDPWLKENGNYSLFLAFSGEVSEYLEGLYVSTYLQGSPASEGDADAERFLVATNLEPTDARRVFPCFDEPEMKAVFNVTIIHRDDTKALGNAKFLGSDYVDEGWIASRFHLTPRMSTYLFAFTVSEFTTPVHSQHERVDINTYARPEATDAGYTDYAASITGKILEFYETYFENIYPQKTLNQIALPDLFPVAMENWGLVTYQEASLLYEDGVSSLLHKEAVANIIAHELAHQWFGNLVTMKWWNELWLNEGFATYMSYLAADAVEPSFKVKELYVASDLHTAFEADALALSHPLSPPEEDVQTTVEITEMFDSITYSKGAVLLRMLADMVGESVFKKGINMYLQDLKYENADQTMLWEYIQKAVTADGGQTIVDDMMNSWTKQTGYPVITINTTDGEIYQRHFLFNDSSDSSHWWKVSIPYMTNLSRPAPVMLDVIGPVRKPEFVIGDDGGWLLANVNCTGYFRVNYNPENWDRLLTQLQMNPHRIPLMNRGQLVDDAFNLARAELVSVTLALNSTLFLHKETECLPWVSAIKNLKYFKLMFDRTEVYGLMQEYLREQVRGLYNVFRNFTDHSEVPTDHSEQHTQIIAIQVACSNKLPECVTMATKKFAEWMSEGVNGTNTIHPNLRSVIYCQALAAGGRKEWEFAWKRFQSASVTSEREQFRKALACTPTTWLLNRYLEYTLNPERIRLMDVATTINYVAGNPAGQALAWNFIRAHWDYVSQGDGAALIEGVTRRFSTVFELQELERFATDYELGPAARAVRQAIEQTRVNIQWIRKNKDSVLQWFQGGASS